MLLATSMPTPGPGITWSRHLQEASISGALALCPAYGITSFRSSMQHPAPALLCCTSLDVNAQACSTMWRGFRGSWAHNSSRWAWHAPGSTGRATSMAACCSSLSVSQCQGSTQLVLSSTSAPRAALGGATGPCHGRKQREFHPLLEGCAPSFASLLNACSRYWVFGMEKRTVCPPPTPWQTVASPRLNQCTVSKGAPCSCQHTGLAPLVS